MFGVECISVGRIAIDVFIAATVALAPTGNALRRAVCHIQCDRFAVAEAWCVGNNSAVAYVDNGDSIRVLYGVAINGVATEAAEIRVQGGVVVQVGVVHIGHRTIIFTNPFIVLRTYVLAPDRSVEGTMVNLGIIIVKSHNSAHAVVIVYHVVGNATV